MSRKIGVILSYILMIFEVLSTLLLTPFIIRTLGQAEYGVYKLSSSINAYLLLLDLGVGNAITRYISKYRTLNDEKKEKNFLGIATIYYIIISIIALIIGIVLSLIFPYAFAKGLNSKEILLGQKLLIITMINSAVTLGTTAYNNVLIAYERFDISKGTSIIQIIIRIILTYLVLKLGLGSIGIVIVNLIMTLIFRVYFVIFVLFKLKIRPNFKNMQISFIKEIVAYSSLILLQMIATQLNSTVDQVLIGALVSSSATILAIYGIGTQIVQYFQTIGTSFTGVLMPGIVKMVENRATSKELLNEMVKIGRIILMILAMIWGVFLVEGKEFINLWVGKANINAYIVAIILMTSYLFVLTESVGTQILWAMNEHKEQSWLKFIIVLLNIMLTVFLIKWKPLIGATIGTFISIMLGDVIVMNIIFSKKIGINIIEYYLGIFKGILPCTLVMITVGYILKNVIYGSWIGFIVKSFVMVCIYGILMLLFGINNKEKKMLLSILKIKKRCK